MKVQEELENSMWDELFKEPDHWKIRIELGYWTGIVEVPKSQFPEAKAAHQAALDKIKEILLE